jgi:HEAT repeat protein
LLAQTPESASDATIKIKEMVEKLRTEPSRTQKREAGKQLLKLLEKQSQANRDKFDVALIDDLADLLQHHDDAVRTWAALALGEIGARATRAMSALQKARKNVREQTVVGIPGLGEVGPSAVTSETAMHTALQRIRADAARREQGSKDR